MHLHPLPVNLTTLLIIICLIPDCVLTLAPISGLDIEFCIGTFNNTFLHMDPKPSPGISLFSLYSHTHSV